MDTLITAKFPFLSDASTVVTKNGADIESLLTSVSFEDARKRGLERLEDTIKNSEVSYRPLLNEYDKFMEILSYPYARMIVSCINDRFLTKRYALSEAVRMNKLLKGEHESTIYTIATSLGVKSSLDDDLKMYFTDYLKFSNRIKSSEWMLVNTEIKSGYVTLRLEKFNRLLQNALQDKIESELPLRIPDIYKNYLKTSINHVSMMLVKMKNKLNPHFNGELYKECLPPCIKILLANAQNSVNLPHSGRFAVVSFLHAIGMNSSQILTLFSQSPDFDEAKSNYQIRHITGELNNTEGYTPPECSTMKTYGICFEPDELCNSGKINHPLTYYRIRSTMPAIKK
ncbi:MAG: DNA primase large subunit PriL [archaeon]|nr:DNA primase large subunit PriL [archaeon]